MNCSTIQTDIDLNHTIAKIELVGSEIQLMYRLLDFACYGMEMTNLDDSPGDSGDIRRVKDGWPVEYSFLQNFKKLLPEPEVYDG